MADRTCTVDGCTGGVFARGWCCKHWKRWRKSGDVHDVGDGRTLPAAIRFAAKVSQPDCNGCWNWLGRDNGQGYGAFKAGGVQYKAHRFSYEMAVGPIPDGLELDHLCRNRMCVNPAHLEPVTSRVNVLRGIAPPAANATKTHCPKGHPYDDANTWHAKSRRERVCKTCKRARNEIRRMRMAATRGMV